MVLPPKPKIGPLVRRSLMAAALGTAVLVPTACGDDAADDGIIVAPQVPPQIEPPQDPPPQAVPPPDAGGPDGGDPDAGDASTATSDTQDDPRE